MSPLLMGLVALGGSSLSLLIAGWVGYPLALTLLRRRRQREAPPPVGQPLPRLDVMVATRDDQSAIRARVDNILEADYPPDLLRVVVAIDAASNLSVSAVSASLQGLRAVVVEGDAPGGKAAALNAAVRASSCDILVFTDTAQRFDRTSIGALVRCLQTSGAEGASGYLRARGNTGVLGLFWRYESRLRQLESDYDSLVGVTGAIYALRRQAWQPLAPLVINDDLAVPLLVRQAGGRVVQCAQAVAEDDRAFSREQQFQRRVRTLTGIYQLAVVYPWVRSPWSNPLWAQLVLHKGLRLLTPLLVMLACIGAVPVIGWQVSLLSAGGVAVGGVVFAVLLGRPAAVLADLAWGARLGLVAPLAAARHAIRGEWNVWRGK